MSTLSGNTGNMFLPGGGGGTINIPNPLPVTLPFKHVIRDKDKERQDFFTKDIVIPPGWSMLDIYNPTLEIMKFEIGGVSGILQPGSRLNSSELLDWEHYTQELGNQVSIYFNGEGYWMHVIYPNDSGVNVTTI